MGEILAFFKQQRKEVDKMVRSLFMIFFLLLLFLVLILMAFSAGWLQLVVNTREIQHDIKNVGNGIIPGQENHAIPDNATFENRLFRIEYHVIKAGETLFDLENSYGTHWKVIKKVNNVTDPIRLEAGKVLKIPVRIATS